MSEEKVVETSPQTQVAEEPAAKKVAKKPKAAPARPAEGSKTSLDELIAAIKSLTVLELAELVKALEKEFGVTAAAPVAAAPAVAVSAPAAAPAAAAEEQTEFTVTLKEIGPNKINVIKAVREVTTLGLKEAKDLVEAAPKAVKEAVSKEEAATVKQKLEAAGAVVEVK